MEPIVKERRLMEHMGNNLEKVKTQNTESIKEVIYKYGPISRAEIAEMLRLTPPTITTNVAELIQCGLVRECAADAAGGTRRSEHTLGRKRIFIDFVPDAAYTVGVESGVYGTLACLVDIRGNVVNQISMAGVHRDYEAAMDAVADSVKTLLEKSDIPGEKIVGMGIGLPGFVDGHSGTLRYGAMYKWKDKPVAQDISRRTGLACRVENNARCRALGEELFSQKLRPETFAYFLISRGLACPLVIRSRLHAGEMAGAGEVGHMVVDRFGPTCPTCGNRGCLEAVSGETAIRNRCIQALKAGIPTILRDICADPADPQMGEILMAQRSGDRIISAIMEDAISYLGVGLANVINLINPPLVIVDGYIMEPEENQALLVDETRKNIFSLNETEVDIEFVPFDKFRAAKGAAALAVKKFVIQESR